MFFWAPLYLHTLLPLLAITESIKVIFFIKNAKKITTTVDKLGNPYFLRADFVIFFSFFTVIVISVVCYLFFSGLFAFEMHCTKNMNNDDKVGLLLMPIMIVFSFFIFQSATFPFFAYNKKLTTPNQPFNYIDTYGKTLSNKHLMVTALLTVAHFLMLLAAFFLAYLCFFPFHQAS